MGPEMNTPVTTESVPAKDGAHHPYGVLGF
jgi:hypothetical protein